MKFFFILNLALLSSYLFATEIDIKINLKFHDYLQQKLKKKGSTLTLPTELSDQTKGKFFKTKRILKQYRIKEKSAGESKIFLMNSNSKILLENIFKAIAKKYGHENLYFIDLKEIKAHTRGHSRCHGHPILVENKKKDKLIPAYINKAYELKQKLRAYNFGVIWEGMIYRSAKLGAEGIGTVFHQLKKFGQATPQSIASLHVMGFGGPGGSYNLEEIEACENRGVTFLHSYHPDPFLTVYMDGTNPASIDINDPHHGNIYKRETLKKYIPEKKNREKLGIRQSLLKERVVIGDTMDFLQTIENLIDAPWPLLIHCKGGRHKTGMIAMIFEYLAFKQSMNEEHSKIVTVSDVTKGVFLKRFSLRPAEVNYAEYNSNVYRHQNIKFIRGVISGKFLNSSELREKWELINRKFRKKIRPYLVSLKFETPPLEKINIDPLKDSL